MQSWKMLIRTNLQYKKVPSKKNITKIIMKKKKNKKKKKKKKKKNKKKK